MSGLAEFSGSHEKRTRRNAEKIRLTLRFLRDEYCSTAEIISQVIGVPTMKPVYMFLNGLEKKGYLRFVEHVIDGKRRKVWGLTPHGVAFSFDDDEPLTDAEPFQPSKVSATQLHHRFGLQQLRLDMERSGARNWRYLNAANAKGMKIPDALAEIGDKTVAVEFERTVKSRRRYQELVSSYLFNRKTHGIDEIWYVCPDKPTLRRVEKAILNVPEITNPKTGEMRKTETLDREKLFDCFKFKLAGQTYY